ncbi:MAG: copper transporter, partial [Syntrophomonadaceae bacterium]|nr:copper transporter [Syntrophomonadaceae bacterium]
MIDIRYHIATLIAVFVALGVGILIGSTLVSGDVLVEQQKKMITQLETQFNVLRERET